MGCIIIIIAVLLFALFSVYPIPATVIAIILIIFSNSKYKQKQKKIEKENKLIEQSRERTLQAYNDIKSKISIPKTALKVTYNSGYAKILITQHYIWIENNYLCLFPRNPPVYDSPDSIKKIVLYRVPVNKIEYYITRGELIHENKISGGGGGGSSLSGAVVGGIVAGGAGAVISSRKKTNPIKSELVTHDTRETILNFFDNQNTKHSLIFAYEDYDTLFELLPEKAYETVKAVKTNLAVNKVINGDKISNITEQIRELAKLKHEALLTEEEFSEKKKALLDKIK